MFDDLDDEDYAEGDLVEIVNSDGRRLGVFVRKADEAYEIRLGPDVVVRADADSLRKVEDLEKAQCIAADIADVLTGMNLAHVRERCLNQCGTFAQYLKKYEGTLRMMAGPVYQKYNLDAASATKLLENYGTDSSVEEAVKKVEGVKKLPSIGAADFMQHAPFEATLLPAGPLERLNGTAVILRGWDETVGRYRVCSASNLRDEALVKQRNLKAIPFVRISSAVEARRVLESLRAAYAGAPALTEAVAKLQAATPRLCRRELLEQLRPLMADAARPVLKENGFREDAVGLQQLQWAVAPHFVQDESIAESHAAIQ